MIFVINGSSRILVTSSTQKLSCLFLDDVESELKVVGPCRDWLLEFDVAVFGLGQLVIRCVCRLLQPGRVNDCTSLYKCEYCQNGEWITRNTNIRRNMVLKYTYSNLIQCSSATHFRRQITGNLQ